MITHQIRLGIRGMAPGAKEERELGWLGWANLRDISRDGKKVLFEEEGDGGGPNYTVFLRDTDGSPPVRIGQGVGDGDFSGWQMGDHEAGEGGGAEHGADGRGRGEAVDA